MRLESGVKFGQGTIQPGVNDLAASLAAVQQRKQEDIQRGIASYKNAIDVPISDISKDWYEPLSKEYDSYTAEAAEAYRTAPNNTLSRQKEAELYSKKQALTQKINMAQNEKELLKDAYTEAAKVSITDPQRGAEMKKRLANYSARELQEANDLTTGTTWLTENSYDPMYGKAIDMQPMVNDIAKVMSTGEVVDRTKIEDALKLRATDSDYASHILRQASIKLDNPDYYPELPLNEKIEMANLEAELDLTDRIEMQTQGLIDERKETEAIALRKAEAKRTGDGGEGMIATIDNNKKNITFITDGKIKNVYSDNTLTIPAAITIPVTNKESGKVEIAKNITFEDTYLDSKGNPISEDNIEIDEDGNVKLKVDKSLAGKRVFSGSFNFFRVPKRDVTKTKGASYTVTVKDGDDTHQEKRFTTDPDQIQMLINGVNAESSKYAQNKKPIELIGQMKSFFDDKTIAQPPEKYEFSETPSNPTPEEAERVKGVIRTTATEFGLDPEMALMVFGTETAGFNPSAKNPNGSAEGYFQITDDTAKEYSINKSIPSEYDSWFAAALKKKGAELLSKYPNDPYAFKLWVMGPGYLDKYDPEHPEKILWPATSRAAKDNKALQNKDGAVTNGSFRKHMEERFAKYRAANNIEEVSEKPTSLDTEFEGFDVQAF